MEPLTGASALASIVSLIGQFRGERTSKDQAGFNEFIEWLSKTQHKDLKSLLETNTKATIGIKALLNEDREVVFEKLERINNALASFASAIDGFSEVVEATNPTALLSEQALSILNQIEDSQGSKLLESHYIGGMAIHILDGSGGHIEFDDTRFIEDDLRTLVELGLLRHDYNSKGDNLYIFTRAAHELVRRNENAS